MEKHVQSVAKTHGIRLLGPNCLGAANTNSNVRMNASFGSSMPSPRQYCPYFPVWSHVRRRPGLCGRPSQGFSKSISIGNKADINEVDLLRYLKDDPDTKVIIMYLEDITDGHALLRWQGKSPWWRQADSGTQSRALA